MGPQSATAATADAQQGTGTPYTDVSRSLDPLRYVVPVPLVTRALRSRASYPSCVTAYPRTSAVRVFPSFAVVCHGESVLWRIRRRRSDVRQDRAKCRGHLVLSEILYQFHSHVLPESDEKAWLQIGCSLSRASHLNITMIGFP